MTGPRVKHVPAVLASHLFCYSGIYAAVIITSAGRPEVFVAAMEVQLYRRALLHTNVTPRINGMKICRNNVSSDVKC